MAKRKEIKNISASVKEKLLNIATTTNRDFNLIFRQYAQERFLYRLSISKFAKHFILKGALLFLAYDISRLRPTRDIDFKGDSISNDTKEIKIIFEKILKIEANDGLNFSKVNIRTENITEDGEYNGIRVKFVASLGTAKQNMQVDIGFGDKIHKGPVKIDYPVLLDLPVPNLYAYSIESAIAEKFEAIVSLGLISSRMKDFYDIIFFAEKSKFNSSDLQEAIKLTFTNRESDLNEREFIYRNSFKEDNQKQEQWTAFINKNKLQVESKFEIVINKIQSFIEPIFTLKGNKEWNIDKWKWE